jgi:hypothetical protein
MSEHLTETIRCCEQEREAFRRVALPKSPCCVDLFRRAIAGEQDAWAALWQIFAPQMRARLPVQPLVEPEEVVHDAMMKFARAVPEHPYLFASTELGPIIAFLNRAVKWAFLEHYRTAQKKKLDISFRDVRGSLSSDESDDMAGEDNFAAPGAAHSSVADDVEAKLLLEGIIQRGQDLFVSDEEQTVFQQFIVCQRKPQHILVDYPNLFATIHQVNNAIKRVRRRLINDEATCTLLGRTVGGQGDRRQKTDPDAFLEISIQPEQQREHPMGTPCHLDEDTLLDYLLDAASDDSRLLIERSPDCLRNVQRLQSELARLQQLFYRSTCPDALALTAYQEQHSQGTEHLVLQRHIAACPLCQQEIALLAAMDTAAPERSVGQRVRHIIEAVFQPPLALALKGSPMLYYQTPDAPHLAINLRVSARPARRGPRTWTLRGELRTTEGHKVAAHLLQAVSLWQQEHDAPAYQGTVAADSSFVVAGLPAGTFRLQLVIEGYEIIIPQLLVGDE